MIWRVVEAAQLGVIGCGHVACLRHLPALRKLTGLNVAAIADPDAASLHGAGERFGVASRFSDYTELLASQGITAVAVCTPASTHAEIVLAALAADKHVFVEKPLALTNADCQAIVDAADRSSQVLAVGFNLRWHRLLVRARELLRSGQIGEVTLVRSAFTSPRDLRQGNAAWGVDTPLGASVLTEQAIHHMDCWSWLLDDRVQEVQAAVSEDRRTCVLAARTVSGVEIGAEFADATAPVNEVEIFGSAGRMKVSCYRFDGLEVLPADDRAGGIGGRFARSIRRVGELPRGIQDMRQGGVFAASYRAEWRDFRLAMRGEKPVGCSAADGARALDVLLAALTSAAEGRPVRTGEPAEPGAIAGSTRIPA